MAGIYPNSDFIICKGVPLEPNYEHTLYQINLTGQYNMIRAFQKGGTNSKFHLSNQSYQRLNKGVIRVGIKSDELYDCNYVMFRNTSYTNTDGTAKWFYAFITSVEYVNDNCADITYEIDVMQTWYFDYDLGACFIDREHSLTDHYFESMAEEGLETGDMIVRSASFKSYTPTTLTGLPPYYAVVFYQPNGEFINTKVYTGGAIPTRDVSEGGTYSTYNFHPLPCMTVAVPFDYSSAAETANSGLYLQGIVNKLVELSAEIISIQCVPREIALAYKLVSGGIFEFEQDPPFTGFDLLQGTGFKKISEGTSGGSYIPKNKKLYQYPYSQVVVSNNNGQTAEYKWEFFERQNYTSSVVARFQISTVVFPETQAHIFPDNYRNGGTRYSREMGVSITNFPKLPWSEDSFQRWWNVNKNSWGVSLASSVINGGLNAGLSIARNSYATGQIADRLERRGNYKLSQARRKAQAGARFSTSFTAEPYFDAAENARIYGGVANGAQITSAIANVAQHLAQYSSAKATPDVVKGNSQDCSILFAEARQGFTAYDMCITGEYAEMIDNYFSMFGYAVRAIKIPNIRSATTSQLRPYWNYIKTENCVIHSSNCNGDDIAQIQKIYNSGITFWNRPQDVGNYSLNNQPALG